MVDILNLSPQLIAAGGGGLLIVFVTILIRYVFTERAASVRAVAAENEQHEKDMAAANARADRADERAERAEERRAVAQQDVDRERALRRAAEDRAAVAESQLAIRQVTGAVHDPATTRLTPTTPTHTWNGDHGHGDTGGDQPRHRARLQGGEGQDT